MCEFGPVSRSKYETHVLSKKHVSLEFYIHERLEAARQLSFQREEKLKEENAKANLISTQREQKLKEEIVKSEQKHTEFRLEALKLHDEMVLVNVCVFSHMRDHGIDMTTGNYSSRLTKISNKLTTSKSMCESKFHRKLIDTLLGPLGQKSMNECPSCILFRELSDKLFDPGMLLKKDLAPNLAVSNLFLTLMN
jgi:hypothetical protein